MKILVYPEDSNPYQQLLYSRFKKPDEVVYLRHKLHHHFLSLLILPFQIVSYRFRGFSVFHIHWLYTFRFKGGSNLYKLFPFKLFMTTYCLAILILIKLLGYKLVWTAHDLIPHGDYFLSNTFVTRILSGLSNAIFVHSKYSLPPMAKMGINTNKVYILSIGNYIGLYPNKITGGEARRKLGLDRKALVIGMFGKIERYKGVIELIKVFKQVNLPNSILAIVGICPDTELENQIKTLSKDQDNIKLFLTFIEDADVQIYINSFDILAYPFNNINTSSSVILSMSFGKPVICPRMGDLSELPNNTGIYYDSTNKHGLKNSLIEAHKQRHDLGKMGQVAYKYAKTLNWKNIAKGTREVYSKV